MIVHCILGGSKFRFPYLYGPNAKASGWALGFGVPAPRKPSTWRRGGGAYLIRDGEVLKPGVGGISLGTIGTSGFDSLGFRAVRYYSSFHFIFHCPIITPPNPKP